MSKIGETLTYALRALGAIMISIVFALASLVTGERWFLVGWIAFIVIWGYYIWKGHKIKKSPEYMAEIIKIEEWRNGYSGWKPR